jgi:glycosyltransferase involved in cell wall biosynthesis
VVFDRPGQYRRVGLLRENVVGYYAHCDYTVDIIGRRDANAEAAEQEMLRVVDVAFAASPILVERFSRYAKKVVHLPCAYNADLFDGRRAYETPKALADVPGPRVMFCGYISGRIDFVGLLQTVQAKPDWSFVFLGAVSTGIREELAGSGRPADLWDRVLACENVHYLGQTPLAMVPPVMAACDVGLVPYCLSDFTMTSSPQKTFEYLAMGKPVVATAVPETAAVTDDIVFTEEGLSYAPAIETALTRASVSDLVDKRLAAAHKNSNAARVATLLAAMNDGPVSGETLCR